MGLPRSLYIRLGCLATAGVLFAADRWTKVAIEEALPLYSTKSVVPGFFNLIHTRNTGMAFSLLNDAGPLVSEWLLPGLSAAAVVLITALLWRTDVNERPMMAGLTLVLAGAAGNLYDRAVYGFVVDFLDVYVGDLHWPAFNVADACITVGAGLLLLDALWKPAATDQREAQSA